MSASINQWPMQLLLLLSLLLLLFGTFYQTQGLEHAKHVQYH